MKVTKEILDEGLKASYGFQAPIIYLLTRKWGVKLLNFMMNFNKGKNIDELKCEEKYIPSRREEHSIRVRIYRPLNQKGKLPVLFYFHGGGYLIGVPENDANTYKQIIKKRACVIIAPEYRKSLNHPFPAAFNDAYDTLLWAKENAVELLIDENKCILAGRSAGGGLASALAIKARDTGDINIAFQMLIYPMLDDRQNTVSSNIEVHAWNKKVNAFAWEYYLKEFIKNGQEIPVYAAPARNTNFKNLPPTITLVGELEPFKDEVIAFVNELKKENIPVEFKLFKGCYHAFDVAEKRASVSKIATDFILNAYGDFYDKYLI